MWMRGKRNTDLVLSVTNVASTFCFSSLAILFLFQMLLVVFGEEGFECFLILLRFRKAFLVVRVEDGLIVREVRRQLH